MHSSPTISAASLREVILATVADEAPDQSPSGKIAAQSAALETMSALASSFSGNELVHELGNLLGQIKRA